MQLITPIGPEACRSHIGRPICAVLHDGTAYIGTLGGVTESELLFTEAYPTATILSTNAAKAKKQLNTLKEKSKTSAFGFGYPFGGFGLAWPLLAALFLLPFLFI